MQNWRSYNDGFWHDVCIIKYESNKRLVRRYKMSDGIKAGAMVNLQTPPASFYTSRILKNHDSKGAPNVEKIAQDFESFFIYMMLKEMDKTTNSSGKNFMKQTYMSVMYEKLGDYMSKKGIGIKEMIAEHMEKNIKVLKEKGDNTGK